MVLLTPLPAAAQDWFGEAERYFERFQEAYVKEDYAAALDVVEKAIAMFKEHGVPVISIWHLAHADSLHRGRSV